MTSSKQNGWITSKYCKLIKVIKDKTKIKTKKEERGEVRYLIKMQGRKPLGKQSYWKETIRIIRIIVIAVVVIVVLN